MTKRTPVSSQQNIWFDAQQVDDTDLNLEQEHNTTIQSSTINNHFGTGVLPEVLVQNILFDSTLETGFLDGTAIFAQNQPADNNLGNQLQIELTDSAVTGNRHVKIAVIGLDFESNLQYETFVFKANEVQVSAKHFAQILLLLFNDFIGDPTKSMNLGGRVVISEARPFTLSRDPIMVAQNVEPNLFFRDFFTDTSPSLGALLQSALPLYNISNLNIFTNEKDNKSLLNGDVTTQIGQKFVAYTHNIQKITFLLSVRNQEIGNEDDLAWNGDLVVSIYPLQSSIDCPSDIAPNLPIDFSPSNIPLAQVSTNYATLLGEGIVLDSVPQPIDFVFSNSQVATGKSLVPGNYYAVTIKRAGSANKCDILIAAGSDQVPDSRITTFTGTLWVDIPEEDLWFEIWTDAAKMSDGQAYDSGHGIIIPKTEVDEITQATVDNSLENLQFFGNDVFRAVVAADILKSDEIPDQRTGQPVLSRQQFVPKVELLSTIDIVNLEKATDPLIVGAISDKNRKFFDATEALINSRLHSATFVGDELIVKLVDDPTDTGRYDEDVNSLATNLLLGDFVGAAIIPNSNSPSIKYRVADARLCSMIVGDVDGDGLVTENDLKLLATYYGYNLNVGLPLNTAITTDGYITTFTNGYNTYIKPFSNLFTITFQLVDPLTHVVIADGYDGVLVADPNDDRIAFFTSSSVQFNTIVGLTSYKLVLLNISNPEDYGGFDIVSLDSVTDVLTIRKQFLTGESISQMLRADIDGDFMITDNDGYLLTQYINRNELSTSFTSTFPGPATNPYTKIGTPFSVIKFRLEKFVDRTDDYSPTTLTRAADIHPFQDMFLGDGYFASHDFYNGPVPFSIVKQLSWRESLVVTNSRPKLVPSAFTTQTGYEKHECHLEGITCNIYPGKPDFDSGRVDFFVPDNLIIGEGGELHRPDGNFYKVDFEVGTIILEIPDGLFGAERTINILDDFIADYTGKGVTRLGFPCMKFSDCSLVMSDALAKDQIRFSVSVQSFSPNTNGMSPDGYTGAIVDGKIGVSIDYETGLLTLNFTNLYQDAVLPSLTTKLQINVFLKKGGFNNRPVFVDSTKVSNMLSLISVFSGANEGGPSALVDLENDVTGVLPIIHGGTGLNGVGAFGTVLTSTGTGLSYQFINDIFNVIPFSVGIPDADKVPKTDGYGKLDPSFYYKNPVYIYGVAGIFSNDTTTSSAIGAFIFRYDKFIMVNLSSIKLEVILETTNAANTAQIKLFNVNNNAYLNLVGVSPLLTTTSETPVVLRSDDIKASLSNGATDWIYEIHLSLAAASGTETAICKMARLVLEYDNPADAPPIGHSYNFVPGLPPLTPS